MASITAQTDYADLEAVKTTLGYYMDGASNGDKAMFTKAFLPEGQMLFVTDEGTKIIPLKDFVARMKDGQKNNRKNRILWKIFIVDRYMKFRLFSKVLGV